MGSNVITSCFALLVFCYRVNADTETNELLEILKRRAPCKISMHCPGKLSICYERQCKSRVPCNKDNDCFFYAAGDVANGSPHPKCYKMKGDFSVPAEYGYCMLKERVGNGKDPNLIRVKGIDVDSLEDHPIDITNMA